jgi:hypothetical protein
MKTKNYLKNELLLQVISRHIIRMYTRPLAVHKNLQRKKPLRNRYGIYRQAIKVMDRNLKSLKLNVRHETTSSLHSILFIPTNALSDIYLD